MKKKLKNFKKTQPQSQSRGVKLVTIYLVIKRSKRKDVVNLHKLNKNNRYINANNKYSL